RALPRHLDDPRPVRGLLLHAPRRVAHGPSAAPGEDEGDRDGSRSRRAPRGERSAGAGDGWGVVVTASLPQAPVETERRRHTFADLYHERTHFQFIERSWRWALLS